jgi:hypothetical protein
MVTDLVTPTRSTGHMGNTSSSVDCPQVCHIRVSELPSTSRTVIFCDRNLQPGVLVHLLYKPRQCLVTRRPADYADILLRSVWERLALCGPDILKERFSNVGSTGKLFG